MILVDADACPVREETYRVAWRYSVPVCLYAAQYLRHPDHPLISFIVAGDGFDAADDRIVEDAGPGCLVVTADLPLADRALKLGAGVLTPSGERLTLESIGARLATRDLMASLRGGLEGQSMGGPKPFSKSDRSRYLTALDSAVRGLKDT